jgi:hypothetical protein
MDSKAPCIGRSIRLIVTDPWEFESHNGTSRVEGVVRRANDEAVLIETRSAVKDGVSEYGYVLCSVRHESDSVSKIVIGDVVPCNGIGVPDEHLEQAEALDGSWWRGGCALIGAMELIGNQKSDF